MADEKTNLTDSEPLKPTDKESSTQQRKKRHLEDYVDTIETKLDAAERLVKRFSRTFFMLIFGGVLVYSGFRLAYLQTVSSSSSFPTFTADQLAQVNDISTVKTDVAQIRNEVQEIQQNIRDLAKDPNSLTALELKTLNTNITDAQTKLANVEKILMDTPERALELPLLRRDMDNLKATYQSELASTRQSVDRVYDQNKWFLGVMVTMLLAVIGLLGTTVFKKSSSS
jgi:5-bromo-4-chloroindolyl phosphate hydrolysis protein